MGLNNTSSSFTPAYYSGSFQATANWTAASAIFVAPTSSGVTPVLTAGPTSNFGTVTAMAASGAGVVFTPASATAVYSVQVSAPLYTNASSTVALFAKLATSAGSITGTGIFLANNSLNTSIPLIGMLAPGTASAITVSVQIAGNLNTFNTVLGNNNAILSSSLEFTFIRTA